LARGCVRKAHEKQAHENPSPNHYATLHGVPHTSHDQVVQLPLQKKDASDALAVSHPSLPPPLLKQILSKMFGGEGGALQKGDGPILYR
jgi:hypothetical protein